jgi:outer membrane lipoprotein-sorting protein
VRCLLTLASLLLVTAASAEGPKPDPEKMLRDMEQKIRKAKAMKLVLEAEDKSGQKVRKLSGSVVLAEGNKVRMEVTQTTADKKETWKFICNGKQAVGDGGPFTTDGKVMDVPREGLNDVFVPMIARCGFSVLLGPGLGVGEKFDIDKVAPLGGVTLGPREKVGTREAQVVRFRTKLKERVAITVWIDPKTLLPIKRLLKWEIKDGAVLTETYSEHAVEPKIDAKVFELPK